MNGEDTTPHAPVPANVNDPDRIAFGLTFRQLGITFAVYGDEDAAASADPAWPDSGATAPSARCCHRWFGSSPG